MKTLRTLSLVLATTISPALWAACAPEGMQIQVLGSGGPADSAGRASTSYLVWIDGVNRVLVDAGSGSKKPFYQAGATLADIDLIALSHFHPDHAAEFPALLWPAGGQFAVSGPAGAAGFPSVQEFVQQMTGPEGVFAVLNDRVQFAVTQVDPTASQTQTVWDQEGILVSARGVPHGNVPTLAYRVEFGGKQVVFTSDQTGTDASFDRFIAGVDLLVIHLGAGENAAGAIANLHATPSVWGQMAQRAAVGKVLVSHISTSSAQELADSVAIIAQHYSGEILVGEDLQCVAL